MRRLTSNAALFSLLLSAVLIAQSARADIGRTPGQFTVDPNGAATYTIPISSPPGPRGAQPNIALTYNSRQGNGFVGVGWNLTGLSAISRCNLTYAQDGAPSGVSLATTDGLCIDGKRLRLTSGTQGAAGSIYQTEVADFSQVTAVGGTGSGPASFIVQAKDGLTYTYGDGDNSQVLASWLLHKISDRAGNTLLVITYLTDPSMPGTAVPNTISWTPVSAGATSYSYTMTFGYGTLPSSAATYKFIAGTQVINSKFLQTITVSNSALIREYFLSYQSSPTTGRYRLSSVHECADSSQTTCRDPTAITYQDGGQGLGSAQAVGGLQASNQTGIIPGYDLNGDGINDLVIWKAGTWWVAWGTPSGFSSAVSTGLSDPNSLAVIGRMDASGKAGFLVPNGQTWWYYKWNGSALAGAATNASVDSNVPAHLASPVLADVNGDGLDDLVYLSSNGFIRVALSTSTTSGTASFAAPIDTFAYGQYGINVLYTFPTFDYFGDGQQDVLAIIPIDSGGVALLHFANNTLNIGALTGISIPIAIDVGDYNDDGCADVLTRTGLVLSACGNVPWDSLITFNGDTVVTGIDWEGSGHRAVLVNHGGTLGVYKVVGTGISSVITTSIPYSSANVYTPAPNSTGDGLDALVVYQNTPTPAPLQYYLHNGAGQPPDLMTSVTDGNGNSVRPSYVPLSSGTSTYLNFSDATYPYKNYIGPQYVTSQASLSDASSTSGGSYTHTYQYYGAWLNLQGRGFSGFDAIADLDSRTNLRVDSYYRRDFPFTGLSAAYQVWQPTSPTTTPVQMTTNTLQYTTLSGTPNNQRYFPYISSSTTGYYEFGGSKNGQLIHTVASTYAFDNYGNPTTISTTTTDNDTGSPHYNQSWTTTTTNTPDVDTSHWCLSLLTQTQVAYSASDGSIPVTRTKGFTPDTTNCHYTQVITEPNSSTYKVTETYGFDGFGNINSDSVTGVGMSPRQTLTNWGATGQFPVSTTDASGATTTYNYDLRYGLRSLQTDANNLSTSWQYDAFGREIQENRPDGTSTIWTWPASISCNSPFTGCLLRSVVFRNDRDTANNTVASSYAELDALDRPYTEGYTTRSGSSSTLDLRYDALGRLVSRSAPFIWGAPEYLETYHYDSLSRLTYSQRPISGSNTTPETTTYQYAGRTTTITDGNTHARTLISDVNGWLRIAQDASGYAVILGYDAAGSKTSVSDNWGNPLLNASYQYGLTPYATAVTDADLGPWNYTYDALGELIGWTDAKTQQFRVMYDAIGRQTDRYEPDLYTHWTWGTRAAAREIGQLSSVCTGTGTNPTTCTAAPGYAESETYDNFGRQATQAIQIPGDTTYTYAWTYDSTTGLPATLTYPADPSGYRLQLRYGYANGLLSSITDTATNLALWAGNADNERSQLTQETLGNHVVVNHTFDPVTGHPSNITAGLNAGTALQNNSYLFDPVGNLIQRQDNNAGLTENVYPDALNRLDHTVGDTNTQLSYDSIGRLATFSAYGGTTNVRDYTTPQSGCTYYGNAQPHAVRKSTQGGGWASFCYDQNGNQIKVAGNANDLLQAQWTSYNQPLSLTFSSPNAASSSSQFFYDHNHQRWKQIASYSGAPETTEYIGGLMERMQNATGTQYRYYVPAGNNTIVMTRPGDGTTVQHYLTADHLGSTAAITDKTGTLVVNEKFAALGWNENSSTDEATMATITRHEFTGQEGIDNAGLWMVNMNGRIYYPSGFGFLSPDPTPIQDPTNTVSYNRYAYVNYNPLTLIDPTGYCGVENDGSDGSMAVVGVCAGNQGFDITVGQGTGVSAPQEPYILPGLGWQPDLKLVQIPCLNGVDCQSQSNPCPGAGGPAFGFRNSAPNDPSLPYTPVHNLPAGSFTVTAPDGTQFYAPPNADFVAVYQYGQTLSSIPSPLNSPGFQFASGFGGLFDFQRGNNQFNGNFAYAANYAIGIMANGAKTPLWYVQSVAAAVKFVSGNKGVPFASQAREQGYTAAASGACAKTAGDN